MLINCIIISNLGNLLRIDTIVTGYTSDSNNCKQLEIKEGTNSYTTTYLIHVVTITKDTLKANNISANRILSVEGILPQHRNGGAGHRLCIHSLKKLSDGSVEVSMLCKNIGNSTDIPHTFHITFLVLNI